MHLPNEPRRGDKLDADWGAAVIRYLRSITLRKSIDCEVERTANGTRLRPRPVNESGAVAVATTTLAPLTVIAGSAGKVRVVYGTVTSATGGVLVPLIGGASVNVLPAPELTITSNGSVYLRVLTAVGGTAIIAEIFFGAITPANSANQGHIQLASISAFSVGPPASFNINQSVTGSLQHQRCGGTLHLFGRV